MLSLPERVVFQRLSVFAGGFVLEAAENVCAGGTVELSDVLELLSGLVDKSVVVADQHDGKARFRLLEPVRYYAHERLVLSGEAAVVRELHARFFMVFAEGWSRDSAVGGARRQAAWKALEQEHPNLRAALRWCLETKNAQVGLKLGQTLLSFWQGRGHFNEGLQWLTQLLELPAEGMATSSTRVLALLGAGRIARLQGDHAQAQVFYQEGVPIARQAEEPWVRWTALSDLASYDLDRGDWAAARQHFDDAIATARSANDWASEAISLNGAAVMAYWQTVSQQPVPKAERPRVWHALSATRGCWLLLCVPLRPALSTKRTATQLEARFARASTCSTRQKNVGEPLLHWKRWGTCALRTTSSLRQRGDS
jgi:tetratricopeptide (TPR) repeat protein